MAPFDVTGGDATVPPLDDELLDPAEVPLLLEPLLPEENPLAEPVACEKHSSTPSAVVWQQSSGSALLASQPVGHAPHRLVTPPS